jgi:transportin-3
MATKTPTEAGYAPVLAALATMQSNTTRAEKSQAHDNLEQFQKSVSIAIWRDWYPC